MQESGNADAVDDKFLSTAKRSKLQCLSAGRIVAGKKAAEPERQVFLWVPP